MKKQNLKGLSRDELLAFVDSIGEKSFRASQLWAWIYQKGSTHFDQMSNLSKALRTKLDEVALISSLKLVKKEVSSISGTRKYLWKLEDGLTIESVFIPDGRRRTVCISSQIGCSLKCGFCATGKMGFIRDLMPHEILDQVISVQRDVEDRITNIVVMGMGEPFLNYDNVIKALSIIRDPEGIAIGHRKMTISTAGIVPQIERFTRENQPFQLAISLNATTTDQRSEIMPINKKYPMKALLTAARQHVKVTRRRITFEYVLLKGVNDKPHDAGRLLKLLRNIPCKVNLIAYNPTGRKFSRPDEKRIYAFAEAIRPLLAPVTLRLSRGDDINGACGQLATSVKKIKKS